MSCCSQRRHAVPSTTQLRATAGVSTPPSPDAAARRLRYLGDAPLSLRGPFSGRVYEVDAKTRVIDVDVLDAEPLVRTTLFEPARG